MENFLNSKPRFATNDVINAFQGFFIDNLWFIIDYNLKGVFEMTPSLEFEVLENFEVGNTVIRYVEPPVVQQPRQILIDLPIQYNPAYPTHVFALDFGERQVISLNK
ncbi:MAG: DUF960 domain-containing protein [Streptococcaceae bacterium]|nr:DUF960 domain-containing protein [Streptococcaceae bacterium]